MMRQRRARFAAVLEPRTIHLVEYRQRGAIVESLGAVHTETVPAGLEAAAAELAAQIEARGGRGGEVVVAVRGFGIAAHMLQLPPAEAHIWAPIVEREVKRLEPGLSDAIIGFSPCGMVTRGANPMRELLVGMAQPALIEALRRTMAERRIELTHVTVVPQAVRRAYAALSADEAPSVVLLMLESGPVVCFFFEGELRLVVEPPVGAAMGDARAQVLHDAIERGMLHLRQQYRGIRPQRILVAAAPGEQDAIIGELQRLFTGDGALELRSIGSAGAYLGLGVVQDAIAEKGGIDLSGTTRRSRVQLTPLRIGLGAAVAASALWALVGTVAAVVPARQASSLQQTVSARLDTVAPMAGTLIARRAHEQRIEYLADLDSEYLHLETVLRELGASMPGGVRLDSLAIDRGDAEWTVQLGGVAFGETASRAVTMLNAFDSAVRQRLNADNVELAGYEYLGVAEAELAAAAAGVRFKLSFSVDMSGPQ